MPATGGYFVSPRRMASIAASLMLSGVSKSGSPAPSPMMSRPDSFKSRAFCVTAMVADGLTLDRLSARKLMGNSGAPAPYGGGGPYFPLAGIASANTAGTQGSGHEPQQPCHPAGER